MEQLQLSAGALRLLRSARIAHLATADKSGQPHLIPICFAFDGQSFYSSIDEKPKRTALSQLKRLRNIEANPQVALVIDRYDEDWSKLAYILVFGKAQVFLNGEKYRTAIRLLRRKYPQYQTMAIDERPMIVITPERVTTWGAM